MKMNTGAGTPAFPLRLCHKQQPRVSLVSPCLSFPRQEGRKGLFTRQELGNWQVWQQEEPCR